MSRPPLVFISPLSDETRSCCARPARIVIVPHSPHQSTPQSSEPMESAQTLNSKPYLIDLPLCFTSDAVAPV